MIVMMMWCFVVGVGWFTDNGSLLHVWCISVRKYDTHIDIKWWAVIPARYNTQKVDTKS